MSRCVHSYISSRNLVDGYLHQNKTQSKLVSEQLSDSVVSSSETLTSSIEEEPLA